MDNTCFNKRIKENETEGKLDSTGKNLLWIVHNGLRILDKELQTCIENWGRKKCVLYQKPNA